MASFTVGGLSTGVDYNELVSKLIEVQRQPITILENKKDDYNSKISSYSDLDTKLSTLRDAVDKLRTGASFFVKNASSSDTTVLDATSSGTASSGNYTVSVTTLASEEKEVHSGVLSSSTVVNSSGSDKVFAYTYGGTTATLTVADGTTLDQLKNLINDDASNPGVTATVVNDSVSGDNYRLILTGNATGVTNTITIDDATTTLDGTGSTVNFESGTFTENKTAADSDFTVDGLQVKRSSNSITDVIDGLTLNLKKAASSAIVSVTADNDEIKDQISSFVDAYNDVAEFIATNTDYDSNTKVSGILSGESTARSIQSRLRSIVSGTVSGLSGSLSILAEIGITTDYKTGNIKLDSSKLDTKLSASLDDVADLFKDNTNGIATEIYSYIGDITSTVDGSITLRKKGLTDVISNISNTIESMEYRLDKQEDDLVRKFTALESLVSRYNTIGSYLSGFSTQA
jgi:flagellar hook-associated protein 2